jgi:hypothetical protein
MPEDGEGRVMEIRGRDLINGVPKEIVISERQISESLAESWSCTCWRVIFGGGETRRAMRYLLCRSCGALHLGTPAATTDHCANCGGSKFRLASVEMVTQPIPSVRWPRPDAVLGFIEWTQNHS